MATHPKGKNCPEGQVYDFERGRCVDIESIDPDYPEDSNKAASNLTFNHKKRGEINDRK